MYSPPTRPGQSGRSFADPSTESLQASMAQIIAEIKELAARVTSLSEREVERSKIMNQLLTRTQAIEARMDALEGSVGEVTGAHAKRSGGGSKGVSNEHPLLKVCDVSIVTWDIDTEDNSLWYTPFSFRCVEWKNPGVK